MNEHQRAMSNGIRRSYQGRGQVSRSYLKTCCKCQFSFASLEFVTFILRVLVFFPLKMGGKRHQFAMLLMNETWLKMVN